MNNEGRGTKAALARQERRSLPVAQGGNFRISADERMKRREAVRLAHEAAPECMQRLWNIAMGKERGWSNNQMLAALNSVLDRGGVGRLMKMEVDSMETQVQMTGEHMAEALRLARAQYGEGMGDAEFHEAIAAGARERQLIETISVLELAEGTPIEETIKAGRMWCANRLGIPPRSDRDTIALGIAEAKGRKLNAVHQIEEMFEAVETLQRRHDELTDPNRVEAEGVEVKPES